MSDAMTPYSALLACALPEEARGRLCERLELTLLAGAERPDPRSIPAAASGKNALVFSVTLPMTADLVAKLPPSIRAIGTYSVGYDHVDLEACRKRGLKVYNTPDVLTDAVAEVAMLLLLGAARRVKESSALIAEQRWTGWQPTQLNGIELAGKSLGIFGMGRIGGAVAIRARAFGMTIHYSNRHRLPPELECGAIFHPHPRSLLAASDALLLASPATPETTGFLDRERIGWLKSGALVVNVGRGALVDDDALIEALAAGRVRAAGLDVFNGEPNLDPRYRALDNVFLLPHIGSSTIETRARMAEILATGLAAGLSGVDAPNRIA